MIALLLAAQVSAASAAPSPSITLARPDILRNTFAPVPAACRAGVTAVAGAGVARVWKLGDLPKAHEEIAIYRTVGGCPAPLIVRYDVERDARSIRAFGD